MQFIGIVLFFFLFDMSNQHRTCLRSITYIFGYPGKTHRFKNPAKIGDVQLRPWGILLFLLYMKGFQYISKIINQPTNQP